MKTKFYLPFLLAWRYLLGSAHEKNISVMVKICFLGILIGTFSLTLIVCIMNGFEKVTHEKLQGIHAQLIMRSLRDELNVPEIAKVLQEEFPEVAAVSESALKQVIIQTEAYDDADMVVMVRAINPESEQKTSSLEQKIVQSLGEKTLLAATHSGHILLGHKLAEQLGVGLGDEVVVLYADEETKQGHSIKLNKTFARIGGIFNTGIDEFDSNLIICSFEFLTSLFPDTGATQLNLKLKQNTNEQLIINRLRDRFAMEVYSWKELYPAIVSSLKLEKYVSFFIIALITLVASMNIISLLFMQITQKRGDIAILKAMGLADTMIRRIFLLMGTGITLLGTVCGLSLAFIAGWLLDTYPFITLPDVYYVTQLPVRMELHIFVIVFVTVMALSFVATWIPAQRTKWINIAHVLRFEA